VSDRYIQYTYGGGRMGSAQGCCKLSKASGFVRRSTRLDRRGSAFRRTTLCYGWQRCVRPRAGRGLCLPDNIMPKITKRASIRGAGNRKSRSHDFAGGRRGAVIPHEGKTRITMWVDSEILDWFRVRAEREGRGYQTAMNDALGWFAREDHRPLPEIVRDVVRSELRAALKAS
jgi:uncharacterized protein (DUF4415 family)